MAHRHHIAAADEDVGFPEVDAAFDELRGARHDKKSVAILLDLGALMRLAGILDGQIMEPELGLHPRQQFEARFEEPDPHRVTGAFRPTRDIIHPDIGHPPAAGINARGDDAVFGNDRLRLQ